MVAFISRKNIKLQQKAVNWKEAIQKSGQLLLHSQSIETDYINEMITAIQTLGPYIVIMPHIALGHASPGKYVIKDDISLLTLKTPVPFGNKANDPVFIIFSFCAKEKTKHLRFLKHLSLLLSDGFIIEKLKTSNNEDEIYHMLNDGGSKL
jgi:PTS system ascorbate-specific IIA component